MTGFNRGDRVTVVGTMSDDDFNIVPAPHSGRTGTVIAYTEIRQPEGYDEDAWVVEFAPGERHAIFEHWLQPAEEASVPASVRVMTDAEAAELGTTCDQHDRRNQADPINGNTR